MKKNIILLIMLTVVPYMLCVIFSFLSEDIHIGQGGNSIESHLLGKDVLIEINGLYKSMDVEEYVLGVLPGTISADYDEETLKVQAILIRTNVLKEMQEKGTSDASDLSYQYLTVEDRIALFGDRNYEKYEKRFERAVVSTAGKVIRQEDALIMALYHEVSIGKTAAAKEVLEEDISYLQSVDSSQDVEAKHYMNVIAYTWEELQGISDTQVTTGTESETIEAESETTKAAPETAEAAPETAEAESETTETESETTEIAEETQSAQQNANRVDIHVAESTENGFVKQLSVGGTIYTGEEAMERYGLSSTNFYVEEIEGGIRFVCLGKGNCSGLSQYGANYMALSGKTFEEIIKYYYTGVSLEDYE